jgi:predicted DNA-binding protein YlxM (UPF0122 family)
MLQLELVSQQREHCKDNTDQLPTHSPHHVEMAGKNQTSHQAINQLIKQSDQPLIQMPPRQWSKRDLAADGMAHFATL